MVQYTEVLKH